MTLRISSPTFDEEHKSPWDDNGLTDEDFELSKTSGLINDENDISEFEKMIEFEEEFMDDGLYWLDELNLANDQRYRKVEVIETTKKYREVDVRLVTKTYSYGIGTIEGEASVYIPRTLINHISIGEIAKMDLLYRPYNSCEWKCVYIHKKINPVIVGEVDCFENKYIKVHIPKRDIGEMIGKGGKYLKKILKDAVHNNRELESLWNNKENDKNYEPRLNVHDNTIENYTEIDVWIPKRKVGDLDTTEWDVLNKFVKKIYC